MIKIYKANVQLPYLSACLCITHVDWNHPVSDGNMMSIVGPTNDMQIKIFLRKKKLCSFILNTCRPLWAHNHALERTKPSLKRVKITQFILYQNFYIIVYLSLNWFPAPKIFSSITDPKSTAIILHRRAAILIFLPSSFCPFTLSAD